MAITGGCRCGAVRYSIDVEAPVAVRQCWCRDCQYFACGGATVNAIFRAETLAVSGLLTDFASAADSGSAMHRRFCPQCGVQVFSGAEQRPQVVIVRVGTLDDPSIAGPQSIIWTKSAPKWACFDPELPKTEAQP